MSPKPRNKGNRELPARWRFRHGAYYYRVPVNCRDSWDGKTEFRLGKTLPEAYKAWSERLEYLSDARNMSELLDRYALEVVPEKAHKSQESNRISIRRLRPVFGDLPIESIVPKHAYRYLDMVAKKHGKASANRDFEVLSHALSKAVQWGLTDTNRIKGEVRKFSLKRRERYVEDWELDEALKVAGPVLSAYILLKQLTGLRRGDLLRIKLSDCRDDGIWVDTSKTTAYLIIERTIELSEAIDIALAARPKDNVPWLFCTRRGDCYVKPNGTANGFDSLWQRFMARAIERTALAEKFQEKDLRKKTASDMPLADAQQLLGHTTPDTTKKHYRLRGDRVTPHSIRGDKSTK